MTPTQHRLDVVDAIVADPDLPVDVTNRTMRQSSSKGVGSKKGDNV